MAILTRGEPIRWERYDQTLKYFWLSAALAVMPTVVAGASAAHADLVR